MGFLHARIWRTRRRDCSQEPRLLAVLGLLDKQLNRARVLPLHLLLDAFLEELPQRVHARQLLRARDTSAADLAARVGGGARRLRSTRCVSLAWLRSTRKFETPGATSSQARSGLLGRAFSQVTRKTSEKALCRGRRPLAREKRLGSHLDGGVEAARGHVIKAYDGLG